jgi:hypothetical protein
MKISLGVLDVPYNRQSSYRSVGRRSAPRRVRKFATITTGELADILEAKYGITEFFLEEHGEEFIKDILEGYAENLARPEKGRGSKTDYLGKAVKRGEEMFREMLDNKELDGKRPGVPTNAAELGFRFGRKTSAGRPSFVDTGLYRDSFRIEVEEEGDV